MGLGELIVLIVLFPVVIGVPIGATIGLRMWGRSVARRHGTAWWRGVAWLPIIAIVFIGLGFCVTAIDLIHGFAAVNSVEPSLRSTLLAKGISEAMNRGGVVALPSLLIYPFTIASFVVGSILRPPYAGNPNVSR
jgi:hypothetical protein